MITDHEAPEAALAPQTETEHKLADVTRAFKNLSAESLADMLDQISSSLDERDRKHQDATSYDRAVLSIADSILREKIIARFPADKLDEQSAETKMRLPHDDLDVTLLVKRRLDKRISDLRMLEGKVPKAEFDAAVYEKKVEPEWVGDARALKKLAKEYGGDVAAIVARGLVYVQQGAAQLIVTRKGDDRERNVTGTASPSLAGDAHE